uniref:Transcriptional cofactor Bfc domain-containing protein n=1 Tax=Glossina austeni TaxID=7395 RepID=A0A1A9V5J9_GLOAU
MAQNFLYMFEIVVDDLLVTKPNYCAPEEFPTCCEVSFRNSVFLSICDREFGQCVNPTAPKCGKCCLFSLDAPVSDADKLLVHVYKKKMHSCKFLIGCTDMPIKGLFDKVMESFNTENPKWEETIKKHMSNVPNPLDPKPSQIVDNDGDDDSVGRREQMCPTSDMTKRLLPIFNLKGTQTGNIVLIIRLVANGPTIVSSFPFARICQAGCGAKPPICGPKDRTKACPDNDKDNDKKKCTGVDDILPQIGRCCGGNDSAFGASATSNVDATSSAKEVSSKEVSSKEASSKEVTSKEVTSKEVTSKEVTSKEVTCKEDSGKDDTDSAAPTYGNKSACGGRKVYRNFKDPDNGCIPLDDPCKKQEKKLRCFRYFACNADKGCPCDDVEDDCERGKKKQQACKPPKCVCPDSIKNRCDASKEKDASKSSGDERYDPCNVPDTSRREPCFMEPTKPSPGPSDYEEFEACLNGSGLLIRVLKDTHQVQNICDGTENFDNAESGSDCEGNQDDSQNSQCNLNELLQRSDFARNQIKRRTGGHIVNHPKLPKIRANIKYSGNDYCCPDSYHVPFSRFKEFCDNQESKVDAYRRRKPGDRGVRAPLHPDDNRSCCVQVNRDDIKNAVQGVNVDTRKKGIEVCYKTCDETDSDVFVVKLGNKRKSQNKKNNIEIELKTPKQPLVLPKQRMTTETQINETELDAALADLCKAKGKGKGNGKGKNKKKK